ncbi:MAG: hypothetical protein E6L03_00875 [Thaumarchaeota archaeon]|nr:MAG: hypothetical protein E6L03_00875 [Nitrososphaerota archaeon]
MVEFDEIQNWLRNSGINIISDDDEIRKYIQSRPNYLHLLKADVPNTEVSFRVHYEDPSGESFDIRTARCFNQQDEVNFSRLSETKRQRYYMDLRRIAYPFGLNVVVYPDSYDAHFVKTFFVVGLTKQYFFDRLFDFIHASEFLIMAYHNLSGTSSVVDPKDLT